VSRFEIAASVSVQAEFADELLESRGTFGLAGDVFEDGGVGEHEKCQLSVVSSSG